MHFTREFTSPLEASIFVEALRAAPAGFLASGLIAHALLWAVATQFAEPSPPPQMAVALALGREWLAGYADLPPLPAWVSEAIFRATASLFALRLASAFCVALAGWILFQFARRVVGDRQGAIAVLLLVSVFPVAFPGSALTGELLQMPLAAAAILSWWIAAGERNPSAWIVLGGILGAMAYAGPHVLALLAALVIATVLSARLRASVLRARALISIGVGVFVAAFVAGPRLIWLWQNGCSGLFAGPGAGILPADVFSAPRLLFSVFAGHFGFGLLIFLSSVYAKGARENAPVFFRERAAVFSRRSVLVLAVVPAALAMLALYFLERSERVQFLSPLLMLGGLAAVLMGGERLILRRQMLVGSIALIFLLVPPAMLVFTSFVPGLLSDNRAANWPAASASRTFTEIYRTRTGRALEYIAGERVAASQIAVLSADRPHVFIDADRALSPWIDDADFRKKGGVVFWEIAGADSAPPAALVKALPAFTPEAPLRLSWSRGFGDPVRLGWAIVPPQP